MAGIYLTPNANNPIGRMNQLLPEVIAAEPVERKFLKAVKAGELVGYDYAAQLADAVAKGVLSSAEGDLLKRIREETFEFISVRASVKWKSRHCARLRVVRPCWHGNAGLLDVARELAFAAPDRRRGIEACER